MPSITAYSPYETLAFFQSVARHGHSASALQNISAILEQNEFIRNDADLDVQRFSAESLQELLHEYAGTQDIEQGIRINGSSDTDERSPKRLKLSTSGLSQDGAVTEDQQKLRSLVDRLYASYKDDTVRAIQQDEEIFLGLQDDIKQLEEQIATEARAQSQKSTAPQSGKNGPDFDSRKGTNTSVPSRSTSQPIVNSQDARPPRLTQAISTETPSRNQANIQDEKSKSPLSAETIVRPPSASQQPRISQSSTPAQPASSNNFPTQLPSLPQRPMYGPVQPQPMYSSGQASPAHMMPQMAGQPQRPHARGQQPGNHGRGSPIPYQPQHPYPQYAQYPPPPQWHPHVSPQPYQHHSPYGPAPQYYAQPSNDRHPQTPQQVPYASYPRTAPVHYMQQPQQWRGQQWPIHSASAATTPVSRSDGRVSMPGSVSSTPWKRKQQPSQQRPKSPPRPERDVSPLTDREDSPVPRKTASENKADAKKKGNDNVLSQRQSQTTGRPQSATPSAAGPSRSQSIASRTSDAPNEKQIITKRRQKIKAEPPTTPLPIQSSDTEQRSSSRRGRPRSSTVTSQADGFRATATKRKRESLSPESFIHSPPPSFTISSTRRIDQSHDPSLVIVSKNFAKTSQLLLSEITSHKLASIFAKPLSERDAPGYKDLVLRPQDLKAIKAAVSKGGRAALVAIEAMEGDQEATPTKTLPATSHPSGIRALGNGFYLVPKTPDLIPPKGIVNSAQLEMELMRMFANAIMFNPLPSSERGFGRGLRLRRNGGDVYAKTDSDEVSTTEESENGSLSGADEGGIIADTREMFNDVVGIVGKWRELEGERMGAGAEPGISRHGSLIIPPAPAIESARNNSVSASSNIGDEDPAAVESEAASTPIPSSTSGPGRKRRRIGDH